MNLAQWQQHCSDYLTGKNVQVTKEHSRLSVYKDSIEAIHIKALEISFPVLKQLLGTRFFIRLVRDYIKYKNWQSNSIDDVGDDLDLFISNYRPVKKMSYLAEVAKIEWLTQSLAEKKVNEIDLTQQLQTLLASGEEFSIGFLPHVEFFCSSEGGIEVWLAHQNEPIDEIDLSNIKTSYWCFDKGTQSIKAEPLESEDINFIGFLQNGDSINTLCQQIGVEEVIGGLLPLIRQERIFFKIAHINQSAGI